MTATWPETALRPVVRAAGPGAWLLGQLRRDRDRWALWMPVAYGLGIALYFGLTDEPPAWATLPPALLLAVSLWLDRAHRLRPYLWVGLAFVTAGFATAQLRTHSVAAPILPERERYYVVEGTVADLELRAEGTRLRLTSLAISGLAPAETPVAVRVRLLPERAGSVAEPPPPPGARVRIAAVLGAPGGPAAPGAFDFARQAYFERLGGVGSARGRPELLSGPAPGGDPLEPLREAVNARVRTAIDGPVGEGPADRPEGALAAALVTGDRAPIPEEAQTVMREAGLAHLLAVSGMNISLVAGIVFFVVRALLALSETAALRWPTKRIAAAAAFLAALAYTALVGAPVPAVRAMIMAGLVLAAIWFDRSPFSPRLLAVAATAVLAMAPEALLGASFQLSFAAVAALIAGYELVRPWVLGWRAEAGVFRRVGLWVAAAVGTTVAANLATAPFAIYHFHAAPLAGNVANLIAVPVTSFWVMPAAVLALALAPVGLEGLALSAMGQGVGVILAVARWAAALPFASVAVPALPDGAFVLCVWGLLWLAIWTAPWRWLGLGPVLAGIVWALAAPVPDARMGGEEGTLVAVRDADGQMRVSTLRRDRFVAGIWAEREGRRALAALPAPGTGARSDVACDALGCVVRRPGRPAMTLIFDPLGLAEACRAGGPVLASVPVGAACTAPVVVDPQDVRAGGGALDLYLSEDGTVRIETVAGRRGRRPWTGAGQGGAGGLD